MDMKWYFIAIAVIFASMFAEQEYDSHYKAQCRIAYSKYNHTPEEINKVCGN
jgi:hypothetical protein